MKKILILNMLVGLVFANAANQYKEELVVKDERIVMIRDGSQKKDYFFHLDKIAFIEKDTKSVATKYNISLLNGKIITIYDKNNYRKVMVAFLDMKSNKNHITPTSNKQQGISSENIKNHQVPKYNNNTAKEDEIIKSMNLENQEKIIALDPLDIEEH